MSTQNNQNSSKKDIVEIPYFINPKLLPQILSQVLDTHVTCALLLNTSGSILSSVSNDAYLQGNKSGGNGGSNGTTSPSSEMKTSNSESKLKNLSRSLPRSHTEDHSEFGLSSSLKQQLQKDGQPKKTNEPQLPHGYVQPGLLSAIISNIWTLYDKSVRRVQWKESEKSQEEEDQGEEAEDDYEDYQDEQSDNQSTHLLDSLIIENDFGKIAIERISKKLIVSVCGDELIEVGILRHKVNQLRKCFVKPFEQVKYDELME